MEQLGTITAICQRHPDTGSFTAPIRRGFHGRMQTNCPRCGRGYSKLMDQEHAELLGGKIGQWYSDRPLTVITELLIGHRYEIVYRNESQQLWRTGVMDYLDETKRDYILNARPIAGTQNLPKSWVKSIKEVDKATPIEIGLVTR